MNNPRIQYLNRKKQFDRLMQKEARRVNRLSNLRLFTFLAGAGAVIFLYTIGSHFLSAAFLGGSALFFLFLVTKHRQAAEAKGCFWALRQINEDALKRLEGQWLSFSDNGTDFIDEHHSYAFDLDIFGKGSLFQWINTAATYTGRQSLQAMLKEPYQTIDDISKRQEAVGELAGKLAWRQSLIVEGMRIKGKRTDPEPLFQWVSEKKPFFLQRWVIAGFRLLPAVTIAVTTLALLSPEVSSSWPLLMLGIQTLLLVPRSKERIKTFNIAQRYQSSLQAYSRMIRLIEQERFNSRYLRGLQGKLFNRENETAFQQLQQLQKIVDAISNRYSQLYLILNIIFLWDYQFQIALERWKEKSGDAFGKWVEIIGEMEALASLAVIRHDHPEWAIPQITGEAYVFLAEDMGHPLLTGKRIDNDLRFELPARILLITGSNMSGKSTLLRTAGINLVLAYTGAPVCARAFTCSLMDIYTCMRVSDNLEQSISSFYAELLRIKMIVQAAGEGRRLFFLLDEIFKGTNSRDRHTGAKVLINTLSKEGTIGLVSTHDLELGDLEKENERIKNYHFSEYYQANQINFDYQLRPGVAAARNAIYLMKMAGIEFDDKEV